MNSGYAYLNVQDKIEKMMVCLFRQELSEIFSPGVSLLEDYVQGCHIGLQSVDSRIHIFNQHIVICRRNMRSDGYNKITVL